MKACEDTKKMTGCGEIKPLSNFYKTKGYYFNICADCFKKYKRKKYQQKKKVLNLTTIKWR